MTVNVMPIRAHTIYVNRVRWCLNKLHERPNPWPFTFTEKRVGLFTSEFMTEGDSDTLGMVHRILNETMRRHPWQLRCSMEYGQYAKDRSSKVEQDWVTAAGLRAIVLMTHMGHRCGYVAVPKGHPLYRVEYNVEHPCLSLPDDEPVGKRSPIAVFIAAGSKRITKSAEMVFDVHGGITYSGDGIADNEDGLWWFGFDAAHCDDLAAPGSMMREISDRHTYPGDTRVHRTLSYMVNECESLAEQMVGPKVRAVSYSQQMVYLVNLIIKRWSSWVYRKRSRLAYGWLGKRFPKFQKLVRGF